MGGCFTNAGGIAANHIAKWDGSAWSALGSGMGDGWTPAVLSLAVSGPYLYAGGMFTTAGGVPAKHIARWNGTAWSALGSGMNTYGNVHALAVSGGNLYAGGEFTTAGGVAANYIARWNGTAWSTLGSGITKRPGSDYPVAALLVSGTDLYAGGSFTSAGGVSAYCIAKWNGSTWSALAPGLGGYVRALAMVGTNLYAGGGFSWAYTEGNYETAFQVGGLAKWNGSVWSGVDSRSGLSGNVKSLAVNGSDLYVGGEFTHIGELRANRVAKWDGDKWSALGSGIGSRPGGVGSVSALAVSGNNLYVGGYFTNAGGIPANHIAQWDGSAWSALSSGTSSDGNFTYNVRALAVMGNDLYVGGNFASAGGVANTRGTAKWDGSTWSALGFGIDGFSVCALAVSGNDLYVGGRFTQITNTDGAVLTANGIAKWNGATWSALGSGLGYDYDTAYALAVDGTNLYVGGDFESAGGVSSLGIARWDGSNWSALVGAGGEVRALAVSGTDLYAAGYKGDFGEGWLAKWDGSTWLPLGSGVSVGLLNANGYGVVHALAADRSGHLFVGGDFCLAGTNISPFLAVARIPALPTTSPHIQDYRLIADQFTFDLTGPPGQTALIQASTNLTDWLPIATNILGTDPIPFTDPQSAQFPQRFYRLFTP